MKKVLQLILSLTIISAVCAAVLAIVNNATKERIANLASLKAQNAAREVLPAGAKDVIEPCKDPDDASITAFIGYADAAKTQAVGYAVPGTSKKGYGGDVSLMVGLTPDHKVITYKVLAASETPGLGAKLGNAEFVKQFGGKTAPSLKVKKDGGEIDAITSATITSRAVCDAIADACARMDRIAASAKCAAAQR